MLVLLPASDAKASVTRGEPFDPAALSFPSLAGVRAAVLDALVEVSALPDGPRRLGVGVGMSELVRRNVELRTAPAAAAGAVYAGVLYDGLGLSDLDEQARRRARSWLVIVSALWGAVRVSDHIPPYRLDMCGRLRGLAHLTEFWRGPLGEVLPAAAGHGVVVECRSGDYATAWRPTGELAERTVVVRVVRSPTDRRGAGSHNAKRTRGLLVRQILTDAVDPRRPEDLPDALDEHFGVELRAPERSGRPWVLDVVDSAAPRPT